MFQINKTVKAIFLLAAAYTLGTFLTYNTFLQVRVYEDLPLMWQSVIQQSFLWILPISVLYITFSIISGKKPKKNIFEEQKLILPAFLTILITGIGIGVHAVAQVVEDALLGFQGTSLFELVYFIDETVGHALLLPANFVGIFFSLIEMNRDGSNLNKIDRILIYGMAMVNGPLWGLIAIEGGGFHLFVLIISIISLSLLRKHMKNHKLDIDKYPYTKYFFVSCYSMVFFILGYMLLFGAFTQPSDLGFQLSF